MSEPFIGEIRAFGFNFAPRGWAFCDGQVMPIAQNSALFAIIGTTYGGNGTTTMALPNLKGSVPMHWGSGPGLTPRTIGQVLGSATVTLTTQQIPAHVHSIYGAAPASGVAAEVTNTPGPTAWLGAGGPGFIYAPTAVPAVSFSPKAISPQGGSLPHDNLQPFLVLNFCIALEGIFPTRN